MKTDDRLKLAKAAGYDGIEFIGRWGDYDVYAPVSDELMIVGLPQYILHGNRQIRWSNGDEGKLILRFFHGEDVERE